MAWTPRSERLSGNRPTYDGFPPHMREPLCEWMNEVDQAPELQGSSPTLAEIIALRIGVTFDSHWRSTGAALLREAHDQGGEDKVLDAIEGYLHASPKPLAEKLRRILSIGGHTLTVGPDLQTLVEVVDPTMSNLITAITQPTDLASRELQEAWNNAYGRGPDPSDAWDHAIKAIEAILGPLVEPNNTKSTLGTQMGIIRNDATSASPKWSTTSLKHPTTESPHDAVLSMLGRIWANPDRHGSGTPTRPTLPQARAVVALTVSIVQIAREGDLLS